MALFADSTPKVVPEFYHFWVVNFTKIWNRKFTDYIPMLNDTTKFKIVDTTDFLSPIIKEEKKNEEHEQLIKYLETRYWS